MQRWRSQQQEQTGCTVKKFVDSGLRSLDGREVEDMGGGVVKQAKKAKGQRGYGVEER